jgi:hypothetical protein
VIADISLIVRTIGRPELRRALDSIAALEGSPVEIVLVLARPDLDPESTLAGFGMERVRIVRADVPLDRPNAANAGLSAASGQWLGFLDEDDWLEPTHIGGLLASLDQTRGFLLAYGDMVVHTGEQMSSIHERGYWKRKNAESPIVSMHSALFSRALVDSHGCRFDNRFSLLEDWDFFVQCAEFTDFLHVPQRTAHYDAQAGSSGGGVGSNRDDVRIKPYLDLMTRKWGARYARLVDSAERSLAQVDQARTRGDWGMVREQSLKGLTADPGHPGLLNRLALACRHLGDQQGALWSVRRACDSDRGTFHLRAELAVLEKQAGFQARAELVVHEMRVLARTDSETETLLAVEAFVAR